MNIRVKAKLYGLKTADLIVKSQQIEAKMTGHALFTTPVPPIPELTAARELLEERFTAASMGDRNAIKMRNEQEKIVTNMLRKLAAYVQLMSELESDVTSSGFELAKAPEPRGELTRPLGLEAMRSDKSGEVKLNWKPVRNSDQYIIEMSEVVPGGSPGAWKIVAYSSKSSTVVDNLTPGTTYWYRVSALGNGGQSAYSNTSFVMAA